MFPFLLALVFVAPGQAAITGPHPYCSEPEPAVLTLSYDAFDETGSGWRRWGEGGCETTAAQVLREYRRSNASRLSPWQLSALLWHEAQVRAAIGETDHALPLFREAMTGSDDEATRLYARATIAFLERDRETLVETQSLLAAIPEPPDFARAADAYVARHHLPRPVWPTNMDIVNDFVRCFDASYKVAYAGCAADPVVEPRS